MDVEIVLDQNDGLGVGEVAVGQFFQDVSVVHGSMAIGDFGIRFKGTGWGGFAQAVRDPVAGDPLVTELIEAMLNARAALWKEYLKLHEMVVKFVAGHELCRCLMQIPGVGPVAALSFVTAIDDPSRFKRSRDVAAYFGLTSRRWQSGKSIDVQGRISKAGDPDVRRALCEAASALLTRFKHKDKIKTWGLAVAKRTSHRKATVAVARKLAVVMHAIYGPAARCKGIRTEWSFRSALIYPTSRGSPCSGPSWLSAHTRSFYVADLCGPCVHPGIRCAGETVVPSVSNHLADLGRKPFDILGNL